jgi:inward rectifier potassium channel
VRNTNATFALTWTVIHRIDDKSPLRGATPESLRNDLVELVVSLIGIDDSTSATVHSQFSYIADEIRWNTRLVDIISRTPEGQLVVDYTRFHHHEPFADRKQIPKAG